VVDLVNNRALYYPAGGTTATRVYGQGGSFTTNNNNKGGISADSLYSPIGVALGSGNLYVADYMNNRVLKYAVPSSNASLSSLVLSSGELTPVFASGTISYTQSVANAVTSLTVTPTVAESHATITVNGTAVTSGSASVSIALAVGTNTITTIVTAQDGTTTKTYIVTVTRAIPSTNANLSNLILSTGALKPTFSAGITTYTQSVANSVASLTVTPTVADATAAVTVNGIPVPSGIASGSIGLAIGDNIITIVVTAQDGITTKTYTVTAARIYSIFLPLIQR
jgi:hypothetical protein